MKKAVNIVYLYSEVMPYAIAVMRSLVQRHGAQIDCICWDRNKRTPFVPVNEEGITFHQRSAFNEGNLIPFIAQRAPSIIYVVGRMDKLYLQAALHFRHTSRIVTGSDNQWHGTAKQRLASLLSLLIYKRYFEYFWVPGIRQHTFARKMGYADNKIIPHLLTADDTVFGKAHDMNHAPKQQQYPHTMVYAGRFAAEKGVDLLIAAFTAAKQETSNDWELTLVGAGDVPVADAPFIKVLPFMRGAQLAEASKEWGVFCLASTYEPWGVVIHEFTMAGLPVICSNHVGAADDLVRHSETGLIFKSGDKDALKQAILTMMQKSDAELQAMGDKGYELSKIQSPAIAADSLMSILA